MSKRIDALRDSQALLVADMVDAATAIRDLGVAADPGEPAGPIDLSSLIEAMMPDDLPTPAMVLQARRNSVARTELIREFGVLTSAEVAEVNGSTAENRAALANRWKREGKLFAVRHEGREYFPGFQLSPDGRPREVIERVLEALGEPRGWQTALWFTSANGYLDARRPVDLLDSEPDAVVEAASHEAEEVYF